MSPKPNIFPALRYEDAHGAIEFLVNAFGFTKQGLFEGPDGSVAHAQLQLGPAVIGLSTAHKTPGNPWSDVKEGIYVHVDDVDAHHARAVAAGATIIMPLTDMDYGSREYGARDSDGHLWGFGTYNMDAPEAEPAVFPEIHYKDGKKAIAFLRDAFGFKTMLEVPGPNGTVHHAEMSLADGVFMLGSAPGDEAIWRDRLHATNVYVADPDAHYARAKAGGADIINEPRDTPWGSRGYSARDKEGFLWGFSTYRPKANG